MIGIASVVYDESGDMVFSTPARTEDEVRANRRVSRTATLDGGVAVTDFGYSDGDRDIKVVDPSATDEAIAFAKRVVENYPVVTVSSRDGSFLAVPDGWEYVGGVLTLKLLIVERISE